MGQRQHGSQRMELEMARQKFKMDLNTTSISMVNSTQQSLIDADQSLISVFKTNNNNSLDGSFRQSAEQPREMTEDGLSPRKQPSLYTTRELN